MNQQLTIPDDEALWEGLRQGDQELFIQLYRKYYHYLLVIGLKEVGDEELVKDVIQQLFLYLWEKRETLKPARQVKAYLSAAFLRRLALVIQKNRKQYQQVLDWSGQFETYTPSKEEVIVGNDRRRQIRFELYKYINTLSPRQRELIRLRFYDGLTYEEIVMRTGLAHRTVYNSIYEALKKLKGDLDPGKVYGTTLALFIILLFGFFVF